jgi:hypothetical protein
VDIRVITSISSPLALRLDIDDDDFFDVDILDAKYCSNCSRPIASNLEKTLTQTIQTRNNYCLSVGCQDRLAVTVMGVQALWPGLHSWQEQEIFLHFTVTRMTLESIHPPIKWVIGALSTWVKWRGHQADHSPLPMAKANNLHSPMISWCITSLIKHKDNFTSLHDTVTG